MAKCSPHIKALARVPDKVWNILQYELQDWDYSIAPYYHDQAFLKHKARGYFTDLSPDFKLPDKYTHMQEVIDWCCNTAGGNLVPARCFLNLIEPKQFFPMHVDTLNLHLIARRVHITLCGHEDCLYIYESGNVKMLPKVLYELDNISPHGVHNEGDSIRVNFILDMVDPSLLDRSLFNRNPAQLSIFNELKQTNRQF